MFVHGRAYAQGCIPTSFNGLVYDYVCPQICSTLTSQIIHIKGTDNYTVNTIPHTPYPWVTATGTELIELYADDRFSSIINLPFPFCFYGSVYNSCVVGSNGIITFDVSHASEVNAWSLTTVPHGNIPQPIPYNGGVRNTTNSTYYPPASIMGAYHDIFPLSNPAGQRRIEYSVVGTAPCRKFVLSFYLVPLYGSSVCNGRFCTQQIVLHENTGIIDIHLGDKPVCNAWNEGLAILGIQNQSRNAAVWPPGKNCTVWNETGTSYRFTPSGTGSRFVRSEMFTFGGTLVATADTVTTTPGLLDIRFLNICPPPDTTRYEIRTTFTSCHDPGQQLVNLDTITTIRDNNLGATATSTNSACGPPSGIITVTIPPGAGIAPFTYVLDGGAPVTTGAVYTFTNLLHGPHTVVVTDANGASGCLSTINVTVGRDPALTATTTTTQTFCAGSASGSITVTVTNGSGPYQYTLNGLLPVTGGSPHTFTGLSAGTHTLIIEDATGCLSVPLSIGVADGPGPSGNFSTTAASCPTALNGTITVNATAGVSPFSFRLDGGAPQTNGTATYVFTGVSAGPHTVLITDNVGCTFSMNITVSSGPALTAINIPFTTSCNGAADGSIRITPANGLPPYTFSLDGGAPVTGTVPYTFINLGSGNHTVQVFDAGGCSSVIYPVVVPAGPDLVFTATKTDVLCNGSATGSITVSPPSTGIPPFQYSINGSAWQSSNIFSGLGAGGYNISIRSANGCMGSLPVIINEPTVLSSSIAMIPVKCYGENNGTINATTTGGVGPYQYSINGGSSWQNNGSFTVAAGSYTILTRDANNCTATRNITVTEPAILAASSANTDATCDGGNDGVILVSATGGNGSYQYSIDGNSYQTSGMFNVAPGNYTVFVKDNLGCTTSFATSVGLNFNLYLNLMADPTICQGASTQLQPVSNATTYSWSPATGLDNPNIANPTANPADTSWYYLKAVLGRCTLYDTIRLNVNKAPIPNAGPDGEICYGQSYMLQGSGGINYTWSPSVYLNVTTGANPVSTPTLNTVYSLTVSDNYGCQSLVTDSVKVMVKRIMAVHTTPFDTIVAPGQSFQLLAVSPGITYSWLPATGLNNPDIPTPVVTVNGNVGDEIAYQVTAVNGDGCKGEGYVRIKIHKGPAIYVPTGFTPNGDGKNDRLIPHPVGIKSYNYFRVFNRWGQMIFNTKQFYSGWDGTINGTPQPAGTYVWMIEGVTFDNKLITQKGTVTLIR